MRKVTIRDFIYLDVERLKSIIAQAEEGLAESALATTGRSQEAIGTIEGGILGFLKGSSEVSALWRKEVSETRSLHDYIYNRAEAALLGRELLARLPEDTAPYHQPQSSRSALSETTFFLATGRVVLNDFSHSRLILDNYNAIAKFLAIAKGQQLPPGKDRRDVVKTVEQQIKLAPEFVKGFDVIFDTFYRGRIVLKLVPFENDTSFRLVGNLNPAFLRDDIDSITYKYGTSPASPWTMFGQVAAIPAEGGGEPMSLLGGAEIEAGFQTLFDSMRQIEIAAQSVVFPEVSVTPIAVYRQN